LSEVAQGTLLPEDAARAAIEPLVKAGTVRSLPGGIFVPKDGYEEALQLIEKRIAAAKTQGTLSLTQAELRKGLDWPDALWHAVLEDLGQAGLARLRGAKVLIGSATDGLRPEEERIATQLLQLYEETGFSSPRPDELPEKTGAKAALVTRMLDFLCDEGQLVRLSKNVVLCYTALRQAQDKVIAIILEKGELDSAEFKSEIASSRKYALAILDFLDARGLTARHGNMRKLATNYRDRLL
jgi:selenocysteine-specific elongation factor